MPDFEIENKYNGLIAGIDEAGRGPWAGPVVAGAVLILNRQLPKELLDGLDDSKKLSAFKREKLCNLLYEQEKCGNVCLALGEASSEEIDRLNILQATFLAMKRAVSSLKIRPEAALVDGNRSPADFPVKTETVVKGDGKSYSIAAASIIAKVYRDHYMAKLAEKYPYYGFEKNAGYGTSLHVQGLKAHGAVKGVHRFSYRPVKELAVK